MMQYQLKMEQSRNPVASIVHINKPYRLGHLSRNINKVLKTFQKHWLLTKVYPNFERAERRLTEVA
jgi:hypothetical protein